MRWETQPYTYKKNNRQLAAIVALLLILAVLVILMQSSDAGQAVVFEDRYIQYIVEPGDTLWSIAKAHRGRRDIREVVWELQEVNGITPVIRPGQKIWVPVVGGH